MSLPRIAVISDYAEENWPSMDLVAEMLLQHLQSDHALRVKATRIRPAMKRRLGRLPGVGKSDKSYDADRLISRFWDYPRLLHRLRNEFDVFHIVDHSYAQLVHYLPHERTVVTCHDIDTFRSVLEPQEQHRSIVFNAMTKRILSGLRKAARVTCDSNATQDALLQHNVLPQERTVVIPNGVHPSCSPEPDSTADREASRLLGPVDARVIDLLHVGSTIARKRIDVLLNVFVKIRKKFPQVRLVRAGGDFTPDQSSFVERLGLVEAIVVLNSLDRRVLAAVYRRAAVVLQPSDREGFGLPVVEAMACGTPVVASDLPVLREVGGLAIAYCPVADIDAWTESVIGLLNERVEQPELWARRRESGLAQAARFGWAEYANRMVDVYQELLTT